MSKFICLTYNHLAHARPAFLLLLSRPLEAGICERLLANGRRYEEKVTGGVSAPDFPPVAKLICPAARSAWLLLSLDPETPDYAFALCDNGDGRTEYKHITLSDRPYPNGSGLPVYCDPDFRPEKTHRQYAVEALHGGLIGV